MGSFTSIDIDTSIIGEHQVVFRAEQGVGGGGGGEGGGGGGVAEGGG